MKYVITESKINSLFDKVLQHTLQELKDVCKNPDTDTFPNWLGFDDCDSVELIEKITINSTKQTDFYGTNRNGFIISVDIDFSSIKFEDFSDLIYVIQQRMKDKIKIPLILRIREQWNINKNPNW
jgi:hypothetical protein